MKPRIQVTTLANIREETDDEGSGKNAVRTRSSKSKSAMKQKIRNLEENFPTTSHPVRAQPVSSFSCFTAFGACLSVMLLGGAEEIEPVEDFGDADDNDDEVQAKIKNGTHHVYGGKVLDHHAKQEVFEPDNDDEVHAGELFVMLKQKGYMESMATSAETNTCTTTGSTSLEESVVPEKDDRSKYFEIEDGVTWDNLSDISSFTSHSNVVHPNLHLYH